jgi:DNA-binding response OmpR family regulator
MSSCSQPVSAPANAAASATKHWVLLCEDEMLIRLNLVDMLEEAGLGVIESGTGAEALAAIAAHPVDLMIIDVGLPDMSGIELAQRLRALSPGLPLIFATGQSELPEAHGLERMALVSKPYSSDQMERAIAALLAVPVI